MVRAKLDDGQTPEIVEAFRLEAVGRQDGLRATKLRGAIAVDPRRQDFFRTVIEERKRVQRSDTLEEVERKRLDKALKVTANAGSYGIFAEMNRKEQPGGHKVPVTVWNRDGQTFETRSAAPEEPGLYCFPPLAALITSAARLMLATLECSITQRGGAYVFCDTDSLAIVAREQGGLLACPGGPHLLPDGREAVKALSWSEVEEVRQRFAALNPYDREAVPGSILKAEDENFDPATGKQRELWCYSISAKRNALYTLDSDGRPDFPKPPSRHGLGHLLNPTDPDSRDTDWTKDVWRYVLAADGLGEQPTEPAWFSRPAIGRVTGQRPAHPCAVQEPQQRQALRRPNQAAELHAFGSGRDAAARGRRDSAVSSGRPYNPDPRQWLKLRWVDRYSGSSYRVTTGDAMSEGVVRIKTYRDVVTEYRRHAEYKSLAPDGQPCSPTTTGLLRRRPVEVTRVVYTGKESNRLEDILHGLIADEDEVTNEYRDPNNDPFVLFVAPVLRTMSVQTVVEASGLGVRTVKRARSGKVRPHSGARDILTTIAIEEARSGLVATGVEAPRVGMATLRSYVGQLGTRRRTCPVCGREVENPRATFCGATCRKSAARNAEEYATQ